jgi:hypothetical protein
MVGSKVAWSLKEVRNDWMYQKGESETTRHTENTMANHERNVQQSSDNCHLNTIDSSQE